MESFIKKTNEFKDTIRFDPGRKQALRDRLLSHAKTHPVTPTWYGRLLARAPVSGSRTPLFMMRAAALASLVIILTGTGVTLAAEQSLPGDLLYPVKIHVTEEARAGLILSPRASAAWQVKRAERRVGEANELLKRGTLSTQTEARLKTHFHTDAGAAEQKINQLKASGDISGAAAAARELEAVLEASLKTPRRLFEPVNDGDTGEPLTTEERKAIRTSQRAELGRISRLRVSLDSEIAHEANSDPARASLNNAELKLTAALNIVNSTQGYIDELKSSGRLRSSFSATIKLDLARELIAEGHEQLAAEVPEEALRLALQAQKIATEANELVLAMIDKATTEPPSHNTTSSPAVEATSTVTVPAAEIQLEVRF